MADKVLNELRAMRDDHSSAGELASLKVAISIECDIHRVTLDLGSNLACTVHVDDLVEISDSAPVGVGDRRFIGRGKVICTFQTE